MITSTHKILAIGAKLAVGQYYYLEVLNEQVARRCASRLQCKSRYSASMRGMAFETQVVIAIVTPTQTQLLLKIRRLA